jgi:phosphate transport system permease protein
VSVLVIIIYFVFQRGIQAINWGFFTSLPAPVGEPGGGIGNAIIGSLLMVGLGTLYSVPIGIAAAIYLYERPNSRLALITRFANKVMTGIPTLIIGLFVYILFVLRVGSYSALAGSISLAVMMVPIITLSAEEMLRMVPESWRDASLALGATRRQTILRVVLPASAGGLTVGVMLAVATAAGQTAPILLTALSSRFWLTNLGQPSASLPVLIYSYAISPFADWQKQAWGAALTLITFIFILNISAQAFIALRQRR